MKLSRRLVVVLVGLLVWFVAGPAGTSDARPGRLITADATPNYEHACPTDPAPGYYTCFALRRTDLRPQRASSDPDGFGPADLQAAYNLPTTVPDVAHPPVVYVIDAFGYTAAESDLAQYRTTYGLPACTTANGCFKKLNQSGKAGPYPGPNASWATETALDLDMVSAICPLCHITLIQANDNGENLFKAVGQANSMGAKYVSMSWGGPEYGDEPDYDNTYFKPAGVVYTASSGDGGYQEGAIYPSTSRSVVAVGGTSLTADGSARGWSEKVWSTNPSDGTGSGCSVSEAKPAWQQIVAGSACARRAGNDIAAVADPDTGMAIYQAASGWAVFGGTSASAPMIAAMYALAGLPGAGDHPGSYPYAQTGQVNDVITGANGNCAPALLCTAALGWDGPTGLGTPNGVGSLKPTSNPITANNPDTQLSGVGNSVELNLTATTTPAGRSVTWTAAALPDGLTINGSTVTGTPTTVGDSIATLTATDTAAGTSSSVSFPWSVAVPGTYRTSDSVRLLDTRKGIGVPTAPVVAGGVVKLKVAGRGGLPTSGVSAVVMNVTVTAPTGSGYLTAWATGKPRPTTSNLNFVKGQTVPNLVVAPVGSDGSVSLYVSAGTQIVADLSGFYVTGQATEPGTFQFLDPARILDTRHSNGYSGAVPTNQTIAVTVAGRGGVPAVSEVSAVVLNVTATGSTAGGYVTVYPSGQNRPTASSLNFAAGVTTPNLVTVPIGSDGRVKFFVFGGGQTNLFADIAGYYRKGPSSLDGTFEGLTPARILDTRHGVGTGGQVIQVGNGNILNLPVTGPGGVPGAGVRAVVLNVTVTGPRGGGYVTVYSDDLPLPTASNLNFVKNQTVANMVIVPVSAQGVVDLTVIGADTDLIADVAGYFRS